LFLGNITLERPVIS
jgi:hypothetical protein